MYVRTYVRMYVCKNVCVRMHTCVHAWTCECDSMEANNRQNVNGVWFKTAYLKV